MLFPDSGPGIQQEVQRVGGPRQLPCPEIRLPALLVQIGEYQEQQESDHSWQDHRADDNAIHEMTDTNPSSSAYVGKRLFYGFIRLHVRQYFLVLTVMPFVAPDPVFCVA